MVGRRRLSQFWPVVAWLGLVEYVPGADAIDCWKLQELTDGVHLQRLPVRQTDEADHLRPCIMRLVLVQVDEVAPVPAVQRLSPESFLLGRLPLPLTGIEQILELLDESYEVNHIAPISKGGTNSEDNLQALLRSCHQLKSAREQAQ